MSRIYAVEEHVKRRMLKWRLFDLARLKHDRITLRVATVHQGAHFIGMQDDTVVLWSMDNDQVGQRDRTFLIAGTGHELPHNMLDHLGTVQWNGLVFHIFELFE